MADSQTKTLKLNVVGDSASGRKALDDVAAKGDETSGKIGESFGKLFSTLGSAGGGALGPLGETLNVVGEGVDHLGQKNIDLAGKLAIGGGAIAGIGAALMGLGSADAQANLQLQTSIKNTGNSYDDYKDKIEEVIKKQENFGNSSAETQGALQKITDATGDPTKAIDYMGIVSDLAAAKHIDLATAAGTVAQVLNGGGGKALKAYGLQLADVKGATADLEKAQREFADAQDKVKDSTQKLADLEAVQAGKKKLSVGDEQNLRDAKNGVSEANSKLQTATGNLTAAQDASSKATEDQKTKIDQLGQKINGQAAASVDNFRGRLDVMKTKIEDAASALGQKLGPAMTVVGTVTSTVSGIYEVGSAALDVYKARRLAATVAVEAGTVATGEAAVAEGLALGPILLVIAAVALLGIGIYELATHWSQSMNFVQHVASDAWHWIDREMVQPIERFFSGIPKFVSDHWVLIAGILTGPVGLAIAYIVDHFGQIESAVRSMPGKISGAASGMFDGIKNAFRSAINSVIGWWNNLSFSLPGIDAGPIHIGGFTLGTPNISYLAAGGIVPARPGGTLAVLAEAGRDEAIIPLDRWTDMQDSKRSASGGGENVSITVNASTNADANQIAREAAWQYKTMSRAS